MSLKQVQIETGAVRIGAPDFSKSVVSTKLVGSGLLANPGVSIFGASLSVGVAKATVSIGPAVALSLPMSLWVDGMSQFNGIVNFFGAKNSMGVCTKFAASIKNAIGINNGVSTKNGLSGKNALSCDNSVLNVAGRINCAWLEARLAKAMASPPKKFDIPHPTKVGYRLSHVCLEGPTTDVYIRGRLKDNNVIELPEYWKGLVDPESITVNLTPIGIHQELFIKSIDNNKVTVSNNSAARINCHYTIYGERKDVEKNIVEYKGQSPADYPGDLNHASIAGYHYDVRKGG
tara:strand:- start:1647 stop:2513 length:867 start_codon:yes stop_codon:yes gene_type:complete